MDKREVKHQTHIIWRDTKGLSAALGLQQRKRMDKRVKHQTHIIWRDPKGLSVALGLQQRKPARISFTSVTEEVSMTVKNRQIET